LLAARVKSLDRRFTLGPAEAELAAAVCRRLDGIPLAIELAAARVPLLGLARLAAQLDQRFELLQVGSRNAPTRQHTLEAVLDWSHDLLSPVDRVVFRRLAVMPGTFTLEQALEVISVGSLDAWASLESIGSLVDRSLVEVEGGSEPRYRMLETTRAYALNRLQHADERETIDRASRMFEAAGDALALSAANAAALGQMSNAMELASRLPEGEVRNERQLALALKLGPLLQSVLGPAHPQCESIYRIALDRANRSKPSVRTYKAVWGYWHFLCMGGRNREAAPLADEIVRMAPELHDDGLELEAHHAAMTTQDLLGDVRQTLANAQRVIALYDRDRHHALAFDFGGHDPGVCAHGQGALALLLDGKTAMALTMAEKAIALADEMTDGYSRATGYYYACLVYAIAGKGVRLVHAASVLLRIAQDHGMESLHAESRFLVGRGNLDEAAVDSGIAQMREALATIEAGGDLAFSLVYIGLLVETMIVAGKSDDAGGLSGARAAAMPIRARSCSCLSCTACGVRSNCSTETQLALSPTSCRREPSPSAKAQVSS
jgi:predicted ATPase